ncbi:hypothetical protein O9G_001744 [Rozella allomycis CSF55]|uniref:Uncharacterized protein n=1 Tax=Rozella allomycis (strain CSF55) TaxID=988480 RepID=A0A075AX80_ROZAC|nr:hypothetical protein O9G_001744 [Rozella allomycis CSF55]|eukprot:EPZ33332.1 hypothetical protein O9G_001744 [Rozella allomycis CSF55]
MSDGTTYEELGKCFGRLMGYHSGLDRIVYSDNYAPPAANTSAHVFVCYDQLVGVDKGFEAESRSIL